jgi:hypothetical protein
MVYHACTGCVLLFCDSAVSVFVLADFPFDIQKQEKLI